MSQKYVRCGTCPGLGFHNHHQHSKNTTILNNYLQTQAEGSLKLNHRFFCEIYERFYVCVCSWSSLKAFHTSLQDLMQLKMKYVSLLVFRTQLRTKYQWLCRTIQTSIQLVMICLLRLVQYPKPILCGCSKWEEGSRLHLDFILNWG